jgi:DNA-binding NarL/FixJ family response regulator
MELKERTRVNAISVWIVEDNPAYRESLEDIVNSAPDLTCGEAFSSGEDLLAHLRDAFAPEVILMDIGLAGEMNGIEVVERLRPITPGTRVVMLTIEESNKTIADALRAGACGYLAKTAKASDIIDAIHDVMTGGAAMSPQIARRVLDMFAQLKTPRFDYQLTERERDVLEQLVEGKIKKRIAKDLSLSPHTVDTHLRSIYAKLHVNTQTAAVAKALTENLIR